MRIGYFKKTLYYWDEEAQRWLEMKIDKSVNELMVLGNIDEKATYNIKMYDTKDYIWTNRLKEKEINKEVSWDQIVGISE